MTATNLATRGDAAVASPAPSLAQRVGLSSDMIDLIRNTVAKGATDLELEFFLSTAKRAGLDPIAKQIYFVKRKARVNGQWEETATIQTGIDGYRSIAERTGQYDGQDEPRFTMRDDGVTPDSCTVTVYRKGMGRGISATAYWDEYVQTRKDYDSGRVTPTGLWAKMPRTMLAKCAESLALRKAFPQVMGGVYTADEMAQVQNERRLLDGEAIDGEATALAPAPAVTRAEVTTAAQIAQKPAPSTKELAAAFEAKGIPGTLGAMIVQHIDAQFHARPRKVLTPDEARRVLALIEAWVPPTVDGDDVTDAEFVEADEAPQEAAQEAALPSRAEPEEAPAPKRAPSTKERGKAATSAGPTPAQKDTAYGLALRLGWTSDVLGAFVATISGAMGGPMVSDFDGLTREQATAVIEQMRAELNDQQLRPASGEEA